MQALSEQQRHSSLICSQRARKGHEGGGHEVLPNGIDEHDECHDEECVVRRVAHVRVNAARVVESTRGLASDFTAWAGSRAREARDGGSALVVQ